MVNGLHGAWDNWKALKIYSSIIGEQSVNLDFGLFQWIRKKFEVVACQNVFAV